MTTSETRHLLARYANVSPDEISSYAIIVQLANGQVCMGSDRCCKWHLADDLQGSAHQLRQESISERGGY